MKDPLVFSGCLLDWLALKPSQTRYPSLPTPLVWTGLFSSGSSLSFIILRWQETKIEPASFYLGWRPFLMADDHPPIL